VLLSGVMIETSQNHVNTSTKNVFNSLWKDSPESTVEIVAVSRIYYQDPTNSWCATNDFWSARATSFMKCSWMSWIFFRTIR
jgi:hypothetical protein